jgi:hypothetical protein
VQLTSDAFGAVVEHRAHPTKFLEKYGSCVAHMGCHEVGFITASLFWSRSGISVFLVFGGIFFFFLVRLFSGL